VHHRSLSERAEENPGRDFLLKLRIEDDDNRVKRPGGGAQWLGGRCDVVALPHRWSTVLPGEAVGGELGLGFGVVEGQQ
jgi:hypothetical protein